MGKRTQKLMLKDLAKKTLYLGYVGENVHTQITIDCSEVFWDYPDAVPRLNVTPPRGDKYPASQLVKDGDDLIWTITDSDVIYSGSGRIQLKFVDGNEVIKTAVGSTKIDGSIETTGDAPTPLEDWMNQAEETAHQIALTAKDEVIEQIQDAAEEARESIPADYTELSDDVTSLKSAIVTKAEEDGYYEELAAGTADQLVSTEAVTDTTPYLYRKSGGSVDIGNRETLEKIVGGTVCWNQLASLTDGTSTANGITVVKDSEKGTITINGTATNRTIAASPVYSAPVNVGDVIFVAGCPTTGGWSTYNMIEGYGTFVDVGLGAVGKMTRTTLIVQIIVHQGIECNNLVFRPQVFNLTKMFGPTIADYIYSLEQANAGAGVAWFRKLFPKDYYPYNPGELISVKTTSHDMVGFNLWDEEWELGYIDPTSGVEVSDSNKIRMKNYMRILPSTTYYKKSPYPFWCVYFDENKRHVGHFDGNANRTFTTPSSARYMRSGFELSYGTTYKNDICINLSGSRNGEYEPYKKHSYPLADVELRGPIAIDADGKLVYSGDEYPPDGQVKRKYGIVDLGTATWSYNSTDGIFYSGDISHFVKAVKMAEKANIICPKYETVAGIGYNGGKDKSISIGYMYRANDINIKDSAYTDVDAFKASLANVWLLYELATPTTEQVAPYTSIQVVDDWGTEEFVDTREVAIPVGHVTKYTADLVKKLTGLPWNFSTLIAPTESTTTASRAYTVGSYLIYSNTLYKVTSAIASGGTITPGTNVTATTIMAELTALA